MSRPLARFGLSLPVILAAVLLAFALGTYLGGRFLVPPGQGLAAPAEAMGYGLLAALIGLAISVLAAIRLPLKALGICALAGIVGLAGLAAFVAINLLATEPADQDGTDELPPPRTTAVPEAAPDAPGDGRRP